MGAASTREHWDRIYAANRDEVLSWFQPAPDISLDLLLTPPLDKNAPILDVGGGTARLVDGLLDRGFTNLTVLDISASALGRSARRMGERASLVRWIPADITHWQPHKTYRAWHDRAVFHFLVTPEDRRAYRTVLENSVQPGGIVVMGTFALEGPESCSGLPVQRYSPETLALELGDAFRLTASRPIEHRTPAGAMQRFQFTRWVREESQQAHL